MKKLGIAFAIAMAALMVFAGPALAWGGSANADVDCSDIDVTDDNPIVGTTIIFSGTVDIVSEASKCGISVGAYAWSNAWYKIYDPDGTLIFSENQEFDDWDYDFWGYASADAGQTYNWSQDVYMALVGEYIAEHGGEAYAENGCVFLWWWISDDSAYASCSIQRTVLAHPAASLSTGRTRPILTVLTPVDSELYFTSDGWGSPTTDVIVYNDGTWQVEIADGTIIQLDGEWHRKTWIEVDSQGNVIGRYGSDGHIIAEEIALSSPITVTKVG
jgi:hypothetical protein